MSDPRPLSLTALERVAAAATPGPWVAFISEHVVSIMRNAQEIIGWTGFDSSCLKLTEQKALARHIAIFDRETCLRLVAIARAALAVDTVAADWLSAKEPTYWINLNMTKAIVALRTACTGAREEE